MVGSSLQSSVSWRNLKLLPHGRCKCFEYGFSLPFLRHTYGTCSLAVRLKERKKHRVKRKVISSGGDVLVVMLVGLELGFYPVVFLLVGVYLTLGMLSCTYRRLWG